MEKQYSGSRIEHRAARIGEIGSLDPSAADVVLPSMLYLSADEWAVAREGLEMRSGEAPTGSSLLVLPAGPHGDVLLAGRDPWGRPTLPIPIDERTIEFAGLQGLDLRRIEPVDPNVGPDIPKIPFDSPPDEWWRRVVIPEPCQMRLVFEGGRWRPSCFSRDCRNCLGIGYRVGTYTFLSCACGDITL